MAGYPPFTAKGGNVDEAYRKVWGVCMHLADTNLSKTSTEYKGLHLIDGDNATRAVVAGLTEARLRATRAQVMATAVAVGDNNTAGAFTSQTTATAATAAVACGGHAASAAGATLPAPSSRRPGGALSAAGTAPQHGAPAATLAPAFTPFPAHEAALGSTGSGGANDGSPGAASEAEAAAAAAVAAADLGEAEALEADKAATAAAAAAAAAIAAGDDFEDEDEEEDDDDAEYEDDEDEG